MPRPLLKVWITRAEPGAGETAARVAALGHDPIVAPLLVVQRLGTSAPDLTGVGALAFTSANAVRAFAELSAPRDLSPHLPVFTVGDATAAAARMAGFAQVRSSEGDVAALAADIIRAVVRERDAVQGVVLHACAVEPAGDLMGALKTAGVAARTLTLYQTVAADPPVPSVINMLAGVDVVLLHSPKAARALAALVKGATPPFDLRGVHLLGLSPACLSPLADLPAADRQSAKTPNDADLLAVLQTLKPPPPLRPVFTPLVWTCLVLGALCILAGGAIGFQGARCAAGPTPCRTRQIPQTPVPRALNPR
jgi:uroporphyrinogen-III synthase